MSALKVALSELAERVRSGAPRVATLGLGGPMLAAAAAEVAAALPAGKRPLVLVTPDEAAAAALARDVEFFLPPEAGEAAQRVLHLPAVETSPYAEISPDRRAIMRRQAVLFRLSQGAVGDVLVVSAPALLRRVIPRAAFAKLCDLVLPEQELDREKLLAALVAAGYGKVPTVEDPGTFAVRGGVVDLFPPLYRLPVRIDLFGDLVESLRLFDPRTQRTTRDLPELYIHPVRETVKTPGHELRARILAAADAADHPSSKTRLLLEQLEAGEDFFGVEALAPAFHARMAALTDYLPAEAAWFVVDPDGVRAAAEAELDDAGERFAARRADHRVALPPEDHFLAAEELAAALAKATTRVEARAVEELGADPVPTVRFSALPNLELAAELARARAEKAEELLAPLVDALEKAAEERTRVALVCSSPAGVDRLRGLLGGYGVEVAVGARGTSLWDLAPGGAPTVLVGPLVAGFRDPDGGLLVVAEDEIFGARRHRGKDGGPGGPGDSAGTAASKRSAARAFGDAGLDFSDLKAGDYLVHRVNGVGLYRGLTKLPLRGTSIDFVHIEYEGGALYLPVYRLNEVARYTGAEHAKPKLDRLGGVTWEKTRRRVSAEVKKMAEELLQLYAQRQALPGHAFAAPDTVFREFEATFPFDETPDQLKAISDVLADMQEARPMDRLVCGDVGYGKTEVALRATLLAVLGGKQVAVLAPTTVLVEQHAANFAARFAGWPVKVAALSRFTPAADRTRIVKELAEGKLDVVVGTHRLLSSDIRFKELGLLVIDEEQRFGVAHKEKLKKLRTQIDVLVLSATPIPRTLHVALMGAREMSIIATPPADRLAIRTFVCRPDDDVIKEGLRRELARGGQAFFVCHRIGGGAGAGEAAEDRVPTIDDETPGVTLAMRKARARRGPRRDTRSLAEWSEHLRALVPEARVAMAHGQMDPEALEQVMVDFVAGKYDVLCSTTIIESGLDIPRANTMFVDHAENFGLSQLYQLRGRIGRSTERAYCYLMVPPLESLTEEARQRLATLQRFTELGAGFMVASADLEIRGAGDFLGADQSGQIAQVGFDTYLRILEEAVAELKGQPLNPERDPELNVDLPGYIPDDYVPDTGQRLELYRRLSGVTGEEEVTAVLEEMTDRYGEVPDEVKLLSELMLVKAHGRRLGAVVIDLTADRLALALDSATTPLKPEKVLALINKKGSPYRLTPDMRLTRHFTEGEKSDRVRAAKRALIELAAAV